MAIYLGWDIGGVHLKRSRLDCAAGGAAIATRIEPFAIWKEPDRLADRLRAMAAGAGAASGDRGGRPAGSGGVAGHGVTMTAELSDVFRDRAEGVRHVLAACTAAFAGAPVGVFDLEGRFLTIEEARERPQAVAAANWLATALLAAGITRLGLLVDTGSTTTDIIPLRDGAPVPAGRTDTSRLVAGELVYTGVLRTPPAALAAEVPFGGGSCPVVPEHFATAADLYLYLGRITAAEYTTPTADGRGKSRAECAGRIARLVCADAGRLGDGAIGRIARHLEGAQTARIAAAIRKVAGAALGDGDGAPEAIVAGAGAFLAAAAAREAGLAPVPLAERLPHLRGEGWGAAAPSAALAVLLARAAGERGV